MRGLRLSWKRRQLWVRLEWVPQDLWIGLYWRRRPFLSWPWPTSFVQCDVWVCLLPCVPLHVTWLGPARERRHDAHSV